MTPHDKVLLLLGIALGSVLGDWFSWWFVAPAVVVASLAAAVSQYGKKVDR